MIHSDFSETEHNLHVSHVFAVLLEKEDHVGCVLAVHQSHVDFVEVLDFMVVVVGVASLVDGPHLRTNQVQSREVSRL